MPVDIRPSDNKVLSISRKKIHCHEIMYAKWDPALDTKPRIEFSDFVLSETDVDTAIINAKDYVDYVESKRSLLGTEGKNILPGAENMLVEKPAHVLSVKCLSDHMRNATMNTPTVNEIPKAIQDMYNCPQQVDLGEKNIIPDPLKINKDLLLEEIAKFKANATQGDTTQSIIKALTKIEEEIKNQAPLRGILSKKRGIKIRGVNTGNIKDGKRTRIGRKKLDVHSKGKSYDAAPVIETGDMDHVEIKALDKVQILTTHFGDEYAKGNLTILTA